MSKFFLVYKYNASYCHLFNENIFFKQYIFPGGSLSGYQNFDQGSLTQCHKSLYKWVRSVPSHASSCSLSSRLHTFCLLLRGQT